MIPPPGVGARLAGAAACLALGACAGAPLFGGSMGGSAPPIGPIKVALVDVLSGTSPYASLGQALQNGLQLEIDALNAQGGLLGNKVQLVTADDALSPAKTATVVKQFLADRAVKLVVGPSFAGVYLSAKPLVERAAVPNCLTNMAADDLMLAAPDSFLAGAPDHANVPALLSYVQHGTGMKKVGLITEQDPVGQGYDSQLSDQAPRYGLTYLGAAFVPPAGDQKAQVQQMIKQGAEAVVLSNNPATAVKTLQTIGQLKATGKLKALGFSGLGGFGFVQQAGDLASGLVFTSTIETYMSDVPEARWPPAYHDFVKAAQSRLGATPNGAEIKAVPAAADCILEWARSVVAANGFEGSRVVRAWEALDVPAAQSVLGVHERFAIDDHFAVPPDGLSVYQWAKNGTSWGLKQLVGPSAAAAS